MSEIIIERFKLLEIDIKIAANNPINLPNSSIKPFLKPLKTPKKNKYDSKAIKQPKHLTQ